MRMGGVEDVYWIILGYILSQKPLCWRVILRGSDETSPRRNYQPHRIEEPHHTGNIAVAPQVPSVVRFPIKLHEATDSLSCLKITFWYSTRGAAVPLQTFPGPMPGRHNRPRLGENSSHKTCNNTMFCAPLPLHPVTKRFNICIILFI